MLANAEPGPAFAVEFRRAMSAFATGVAVVTARDDRGDPVGTTVNALSSLSLEPPLVIVCLSRASVTLQALRSDGAFVINILAEDQVELSSGFARSASREPWQLARHRAGPTGVPHLLDALATLECVVEHELPGGDHQIVVGRVLEVATDDKERAPLLFYRGVYASVSGTGGPARSGVSQAGQAGAPAVTCSLPLREGAFEAFARSQAEEDQVTLALVHGDCGRLPALLHVHFGCLLGDVFGSHLCGCQAELARAVEEILAAGAGVLLYTKPPGTQSPLSCPSSRRLDGDRAVELLRAAGVGTVRLGTSVNPRLSEQLEAEGLAVDRIDAAA